MNGLRNLSLSPLPHSTRIIHRLALLEEWHMQNQARISTAIQSMQPQKPASSFRTLLSHITCCSRTHFQPEARLGYGSHLPRQQWTEEETCIQFLLWQVTPKTVSPAFLWKAGRQSPWEMNEIWRPPIASQHTGKGEQFAQLSDKEISQLFILNQKVSKDN